MRALGIDPGTKRIGVAVSDRSGTIASPLTVIERGRRPSEDHARIARLVQDEQVEVVVVGLPINMDGTRGKAAERALAEAHRLASVVGVPVEMHDERRTTVSADRSMLEAGLDAVQRRRRVDKVAAAIMLQSWLDGRRARQSG